MSWPGHRAEATEKRKRGGKKGERRKEAREEGRKRRMMQIGEWQRDNAGSASVPASMGGPSSALADRRPTVGDKSGYGCILNRDMLVSC